MRSTRGAFFALAALGGFMIWRNRFAIQRQLEAMGIKTPVLGTGELNVTETAKSVVSKVAGKMDRGATIAEHTLNRDINH